jgi:hypothetical protein
MTLNQIITEIKNYGETHPQIKTVYFGEFSDKLDDNDVIYPAMFFDMVDAAISNKLITYNFVIYLLDRHLVETDALEVLSDMNLVAQDIVAEFRNPSNEWIAGDTIAVNYFREDSPDYLAGASINISVTLPSLNNRCQIPT